MEIVTEPDIALGRGGQATSCSCCARPCVELGVSDAEMEKGTLRCDANISRPPGGRRRAAHQRELKNMNSFSFIGRGIEAEIARQIEVYESGGEVTQDTYDYDAASDTLTVHRSKEEAQDYRYFPEPDLVPYEPGAELIERLKSEIPESPGSRIARLEKQLGYEAALALVTSGEDGLFEKLVETVEVKTAANFLMNEFIASGVDPNDAIKNASELAKVIGARSNMQRSAYKDAIAASGSTSFSAADYISQTSVSDTSELEPVIEKILAANPAQVEQFRGGKEGVLGFFVGQVMRETQGKADPKVVNELLRAKLSV